MLIYPGYKFKLDKVIGNPFTIFHEHFKKALQNTKTLLFIGFAFRDEYINELIRNNIQAKATIYIINPSIIDETKLPIGKNNIHQINHGFDRRSINEFLQILEKNNS